MPASNTQTLWHVPYQRNPFFTGRHDLLAQLHRALQADATVALSHPQGISGLGGIGKTQAALEYAYRHGTEYQAILWARADSVAALTSGFVEFAHVLKLPERNEQDQNIIVEAVLRWFRRESGWLLVFDNMDDLSVAESFLPKAGPGHIVFTTRAHSLGGIAQRLDVQKMEPDIGALLLLRRASLLALQAALNMVNLDDQNLARAISQELDGLPLALDQAGAYIKEAPCPLPDYLPRYQTRRGDILRERGSFDQDYPASVTTTWSLSFEKVTQINPAMVDLLDLCAFLAPDAIPEEIITAGVTYLSPLLQPVIADPLLFDRSIADLLRYSLIARNASEDGLSIHRLVQSVLQDNMTTERRKYWIERAVQILTRAFPSIGFATWAVCDRLQPHALVGAGWIEQEQLLFPEAGHLLNQSGSYLNERGMYTEAEPLLRKALAIREQVWGSLHLNTATSLNDLAFLYYKQGKYTEAEPLYQRALSIREHELGAEDYGTAISLNGLAMLYWMQGKYKEAEPLYIRVLSIHKQHLGPDHLDTASSLNNLAVLYCSQGRYEEAEPILRRVLSIRERWLEPLHPGIATSLTGLAELYMSQGKYEEAEPLLRQALSIREQSLGPLHSDTTQCVNDLAALYFHQGKYEEAEPMLRQALSVREQQLGPLHSNIATCLNNLAAVYDRQGKYEEAEPLYIRALAIREQCLEADHPDIVISLNNLAVLYDHRGKYEEGELLYVRALAICEQHLGSKHPLTPIIQKKYASHLRTMGHNEGAKQIGE